MSWIVEHLPARDEWTKKFDHSSDAVAELRSHICSDCLQGIQGFVDPSAPGGIRYEQRLVPDVHSAADLLSTPCGMEFDLYEETESADVAKD